MRQREASLPKTGARRWRRARGLAPIELVMWLPVFLLVAALMVNIGTMQAWRLRGEIAARNAALTTRYPAYYWHLAPPPDHWQGVAYNVVAVAPPAEIAPAALQYPALRGPLNGLAVRPLLDADALPATIGQSRVRRPFPMLGRLAPYDSNEIRHVMLGGTWTVWEMPLSANTRRRTMDLYVLPLRGAP